jgi:hypothetical protein
MPARQIDKLIEALGSLLGLISRLGADVDVADVRPDRRRLPRQSQSRRHAARLGYAGARPIAARVHEARARHHAHRSGAMLACPRGVWLGVREFLPKPTSPEALRDRSVLSRVVNSRGLFSFVEGVTQICAILLRSTEAYHARLNYHPNLQSCPFAESSHRVCSSADLHSH